MSTTHLKFGIPDIELPRAGGGKVNPSSFAGHVLIVVFCPGTADAEAMELADYQKHACELAEYDAWLLTVSELARVAELESSQCLTAAADDVDGSAWTAFRDIAPPALKLERTEGATFLFGRGGPLQRIWAGSGHAAEVVGELAQPFSETTEVGTTS